MNDELNVEYVEEEPRDRRWYDKYPKVDRVLDLLKEYSESELEFLLKDIIETAGTLKKNRVDSELISLGIDKIKCIMQAENKQRWYDQRGDLYLFMNSLSTMKEEDFSNVIDALFTSLYSGH